MLVDKQENDLVVDVVEPNKVDNVYIWWVYIIGGGATIVVGLAILTLKKVEQTTWIRVTTEEEMNLMWCCVSSVVGRGRISVMAGIDGEWEKIPAITVAS